jgi:hypothetical protein
VPRYLLHIEYFDETIIDEEGAEFASLDVARSEAMAALRELFAAAILVEGKSAPRSISICNEATERLARIGLDLILPAGIKTAW